MDIEKARELVSDIVGRRMLAENGKPSADIVKFLIEMQMAYRFYMIDRDSVRILWSTIRNSSPLLHFILSSTQEFLLRLPNGQQDYKVLVENVGYSACLAGQVTSSGSMIDADTQDRIGKEKEVKELLQSNPWLLFILILESINDIIAAMEDKPKGVKQ